MTDEIDGNIDDQVDNAMKVFGDELNDDSPEDAGIIPDAGAEELTEGDDKTNEVDEVEPEVPALEPPASWRSDEKELFKNLPRDVQETALRLQQASDSHFTQRSTELATKIRATDDERQQYQAERTRYASELTKLTQMATQLMPAKFSDITSEADYLRLKATDPARASEFEAFQQILNGSMRQAESLNKQRMNENLNREWGSFVSKYPEFQDATKATAMMDSVRKGAVEYYGYTPQETQIIADHRQITVMRDALAWRQYQSNLKAAQAKKTIPMQQRVIKTNANTSVSSNKSALLNRARGTDKIYDKVDSITRYLESQG